MVEIINFVSPNLSWNFDTVLQKESLQRSGCVGAVLQNKAHIYGGYKVIEQQRRRKPRGNHGFQMIDEPKLMTYNDGFIIGQPNTNVEKMLDRRRYASGIILDNALWVVGGSSEDTDHNNRTRLSSTEFINGCNNPPIKGLDLNTPKAFKPDPGVMPWYGPIAKNQWMHGIDQQCMIQYDESSTYMIGGWQHEEGPEDSTWILNPLDKFTKKLSYSLKTARSNHCCGKMYSRDKSKILLVAAGGGGGVNSKQPHAK